MVVQAEKAFEGEDTKLALEVVVKSDKKDVTQSLAQLLTAYATHSIVSKGRFVFAVSSDGPVLAMLSELTTLSFGKADWSQVREWRFRAARWRACFSHNSDLF